jgi:hypothetical protein
LPVEAEINYERQEEIVKQNQLQNLPPSMGARQQVQKICPSIEKKKQTHKHSHPSAEFMKATKAW